MADNHPFAHEMARHGEVKTYTVSDPHPLFGKDPNILNEYGHTEFPMWVDHPTEKRVDYTTTHRGNPVQAITNEIKTNFPTKVLVQDQDEYDALLGSGKKGKTPEGGWPAK